MSLRRIGSIYNHFKLNLTFWQEYYFQAKRTDKYCTFAIQSGKVPKKAQTFDR